MHRISFPGLGIIFMYSSSSILWFMLSDTVDHGSWHFVAGSCGSCTLNIHFVVRSFGSWIFQVCSVVRSWGHWILRILDPKFLFQHGILEDLDLDFWIAVGPWRSLILNFCFVVRTWILWVLTKWFCREIQWILDLDILLRRQILQIFPNFWLRHMSASS